MTRITYAVNGVNVLFTAVGHAEYARPGEPDIVCAAVSALISLLAELVTRAHADDKLRKPPIICLEPGNVQITVVPRRMFLMELREQFGVIMIGLEMLAEQYADHVYIQKGDNA